MAEVGFVLMRAEQLESEIETQAVRLGMSRRKARELAENVGDAVVDSHAVAVERQEHSTIGLFVVPITTVLTSDAAKVMKNPGENAWLLVTPEPVNDGGTQQCTK